MGGVIDAIIDIIIDVIEAIVDLVETIIDIVVDLVDTVIDILAGLLGFDEDKTVEDFQVLNQPLFDNPDKSYLTQIVYDSVVAEEDYVANVLYASVFQSGKKNIRQFTELIDNGNYFEDFPSVQANIVTVDYDEVDSVLTTINSTPVTIDTARLGTLFVPTWIKYWLQENKSYNHTLSTFVHSGTTYTVNVYNSVYNSSSNDYTLRLGNPLANFTAFNIPTKPTGLHYLVSYHRDNAVNTPLTWVYKVGAGTYTDLDDPSQQFGTTGATTLDILPAIPLRLNNTNFNATTTTKSQQISTLVDKVGLDAGELIDNVMDDVATAGISNYQNKVDHVYLNFGVRLWETSQIGLNYLFRFISTLYPGQASTEGDYNAAPDDKPYNSLLVTGTDYKYAFTFAYIKFNNYTLSQVNADSSSTIFAAYYSDLTKFTSGQAGNSDLISTYYASSGYATYKVGYLATSTSDVTSFLGGSLAQQSNYSAEAANWMQPTQKLNFTGTLINADDTINTDGVLKPSLIYEQVPSANVLQTQYSTTYQITAGSSTIKIEISGGGGAGGGARAGNGSGNAGTSGGTSYARVYNAGGTLLNTYSASGGAGGAADIGGGQVGETGESFGGPGSNGVPSGAHSSFSGSGGAGGNDGNGSNASGYSAGGGGGGDDDNFLDFDVDRYGRNGDRGAYYTVNHTVANYTDYVVITLGAGGQGSGHRAGGHGSQGRCVITPSVVTNGLQLVNRAAEETTVTQEMIYYQVVSNGLNAYTLKAPKCMLRVVDTQTSKFKMVNFNLAERTDLMVPMSYDMVKDLPNAHVSSLFLAAAHISIYVADVQVIETPIWVKLLKIVQVVLFVMALLGAVGIREILNIIIKQVLTNYLLKSVMQALVKIDPKLAMIAAAAYVYYSGGFDELDLTTFKDLSAFLGDLSNLIGDVFEMYAQEELEDLSEDERKEKILQDKQMNALYEVQQELFQNNDGSAMNLASISRVHRINPMSPTQYYSTTIEDYHLIGFADFDVENKITSIYEPELLIT